MSQVTQKIQVPDKMVGFLIGKGGENIKSLHISTGARITGLYFFYLISWINVIWFYPFS
jgi:hypothetical protein